MKFAVLCGLGVFSVVAALCVPASAAAPKQIHPHVCLDVSNIDHLSFPDNKTILFHMKGGKVKIWKNTLKYACPNMKFQGGIAYEVHGGEICGNAQQFSVIKFKNPCVMGTFSPYTPPEDTVKKHG